MEKKKRFFLMDDVKELSRQAHELGLAQFTITGGEPTIFPDLDELVATLDPVKFWIAMDSNGWYLDARKAKHLVDIGIKKVHISIDSAEPHLHDSFRDKPGSHARALNAVHVSRDAGLSVLINTVVTKQRARTQEFKDFLAWTGKLGVPVVMMLAKPAGRWDGRRDVTITVDDLAYLRTLEKKYNVFTHLVPCHGYDFGCVAGKRMVSITRYGDLMPCPWIHTSMGNFFEEPLKVLLDRVNKNRFFKMGTKWDTCLGSVEGEFLNDYVSNMEGKPFPVPYKEVFKKEDFE